MSGDPKSAVRLSAAPQRAFPPDDVLWEGRPALGPHLPDLLAGLAALLGSFPVLALGLWQVFGAELSRAAVFGAMHAGLVGLAVVMSRSLGAGPALVPAAAFALPVLIAAILAAETPNAMCAATFAALVGAGVTWRFKQRLGERYELTADRAAIGTPGRYTIVFPIAAPPVVRPDRFGGALAEVTFAPAEARLTTRDGQTFKLPAQRRSFLRVRDAQRIVDALASRGG